MPWYMGSTHANQTTCNYGHTNRCCMDALLELSLLLLLGLQIDASNVASSHELEGVPITINGIPIDARVIPHFPVKDKLSVILSSHSLLFLLGSQISVFDRLFLLLNGFKVLSRVGFAIAFLSLIFPFLPLLFSLLLPGHLPGVPAPIPVSTLHVPQLLLPLLLEILDLLLLLIQNPSLLLNSLCSPSQSLCCPFLLGQELWFCLCLLLGFLLLKKLLQGERFRSLCFHRFFTLFLLLSS